MAHDKNPLDQFAEVPPSGYRRRDRIARAQMWLPVLAVAAAGLFWAGEWLLRGETRYHPGPLAHVHAMWDDRCAACHITSQPLGGHNWTSLVMDHTHGADAQCQTCHAGPQHHASEKPDSVPGCTSCHREHRGREADLKRVANEQCVCCHGDLGPHVKDGATTSFGEVTSFSARSHPQFRLIRDHAKDPGKIAFNHQLHLAAGLRESPDAAVPFTLADIPAGFRERYSAQGQTDQAPVKLDCAACHRTDNDPNAAAALVGLPRNFVQPARPAGGAMLPIVYEQHCQACHPLTFAAKSKDPKAELPQVRHRLQPDEVHAWLRGYFTERLLKEQQVFLEQPARPLPGKNPERDAAAKKVNDVLQAKIDAAERILFGPSTCGKCHLELRPDLGSKQRIEPAGIPAVWFLHARFDHTAHRGVGCRACHTSVETSRTQADVLLPDRDTCLTCHAPAYRVGAQFVGGARHDCVECHRYHNGDQPLHGRGRKIESVSPRAAASGSGDVSHGVLKKGTGPLESQVLSPFLGPA